MDMGGKRRRARQVAGDTEEVEKRECTQEGGGGGDRKERDVELQQLPWAVKRAS